MALFLVCLAVLGSALGVGGSGLAQKWDRDQDRSRTDRLYPRLAGSGSQIRDAFEKALAGDPAAVARVVSLLDHSDEEVAQAAASVLGRCGGQEAALALEAQLSSARSLPTLRAAALIALGRRADPDAAALALRALAETDASMKQAACMALGLLGDSTHGPAILRAFEKGSLRADVFEVLAHLGDPPGSTAVSERLLQEANAKTNDFDDRVLAALALRELGRAEAVRDLLDRSAALDSMDALIALRLAMDQRARQLRLTLSDQASVDRVLEEMRDPALHTDGWGRPFRARWDGGLEALSDGPDRLPGTADDLSTAEPFAAYDARVFPALVQ